MVNRNRSLTSDSSVLIVLHFISFSYANIPPELVEVRDLQKQSCVLLVRQLVLYLPSDSDATRLEIFKPGSHVERDRDSDACGPDTQNSQNLDIDYGHLVIGETLKTTQES